VTLLEPGGYLDWAEASMDHIFKSSIHNTTVQERKYGLSKVVGWHDAWVPNMEMLLQEQGLEEVVRHYVAVVPQWLRAWGHLQVLVMKEHQRGAVAKYGKDYEKVKALDDILRRWSEEAKEGFYTYYDPVIVTARKPRT